ncbi:MAG: helix-turn-helix transcriptional regulator [Chitinispirillaceae bacterium]|nr:helix-turn-helix transcriptional regulator [Chitinispirillaceae bacterium]
MIHLAFFASVFSLCTGAVSLTISLLFYLRYRNKVALWYTAMLGMVILLVTSRMVELYCVIIAADHTTIAKALPLIIEKLGYSIGMIAGPRFCLHLIGVSIDKRFTTIMWAVTVLYVMVAAAEIITMNTRVATVLRLGVGLPILFGAYVGLCIIAALKLDSIAAPQLRIAVKLFFILSLIVLPLALVKYFRNLPYFPWHLENSLSLCAITVASVFFAVRFFNQPAFLFKGNISDHFRRRFGTTTREEEIVLLAVQGLSNNAIGDKLCISVRTVESHLYSIFQKTGVKNRVQLINLIATNSSD